jgi:hypothetical protein
MDAAESMFGHIQHMLSAALVVTLGLSQDGGGWGGHD